MVRAVLHQKKHPLFPQSRHIPPLTQLEQASDSESKVLRKNKKSIKQQWICFQSDQFNILQKDNSCTLGMKVWVKAMATMQSFKP